MTDTKEIEALIERLGACARAGCPSSDAMAALRALIAERDALIQDRAQLVLTASAEARIANEAVAERDQLKADAQRLDFLIAQDASVARSRDGDVWHVGRFEDADGDMEWVRLGPTCDSPRQAIDAAFQASKEQ